MFVMIAGSHWLTAGVFDCVAAVEGPAAEEVFPPQAVSTRSDEARTHTESRSGSNRLNTCAHSFVDLFLRFAAQTADAPYAWRFKSSLSGHPASAAAAAVPSVAWNSARKATLSNGV
jgi:hypothetical protein